MHKYDVVKNYILSKIKSEEYLPDQRLPKDDEISELLGVSTITVRKAMGELVNENIIYRVRGRGSFVKGKPSIRNSSSQSLVTFLLSTNDANDSSYIRIIIGIRRYLSQVGYSLIVENPGEDPARERQAIDKYLDSGVAGYIIYPSNPELSVENFRYLKDKNIPFVTMDRYAKYFPTNTVVCNNHDGAFSAVEHLISLGHKKIGFISEKFYLSSEKERFEGYTDALHYASLEVDDELLFLEPKVDYDRLIKAVKTRKITALFCVNDRRGLEVINAFTERGIRIPQDVSIMGFDDYEASKLSPVPLSTVKQHFEEVGYWAAKMLLKTIENPNLQFSKMMIGCQLVIRKSTAPLV